MQKVSASLQRVRTRHVEFAGCLVQAHIVNIAVRERMDLRETNGQSIRIEFEYLQRFLRERVEQTGLEIATQHGDRAERKGSWQAEQAALSIERVDEQFAPGCPI